MKVKICVKIYRNSQVSKCFSMCQIFVCPTLQNRHQKNETVSSHDVYIQFKRCRILQSNLHGMFLVGKSFKSMLILYRHLNITDGDSSYQRKKNLLIAEPVSRLSLQQHIS